MLKGILAKNLLKYGPALLDAGRQMYIASRRNGALPPADIHTSNGDLGSALADLRQRVEGVSSRQIEYHAESLRQVSLLAHRLEQMEVRMKYHSVMGVVALLLVAGCLAVLVLF